MVKFGGVLAADAARVHDSEKISTYFTSLYTKKLIKKLELQSVNLETSLELLIVVNLIYRGRWNLSKVILILSWCFPVI